MKKPKKTKPKIGIWTRIKNIYDNSPWHSAFTYPILFLIICICLFGGFLSIGLENIGFFFLILFYLTPLWVLLGLIVSKRRLPYLLSLIIGLAIPITIGMVAYNGYTASAKKNATKTIHTQTIKYIKSEYDKCRNGETLIMNNTLKCSDMDSKSLIQATLNASPNNNPYHNTDNAVRSSNNNTTDEDVGYVSLSASGSNIIIKTCIKTPCKKEENRLQDSIGIK